MKTLSTLLASALIALAGSVCFTDAADESFNPTVAPSLERPTSATKAPRADGFMQRWIVLEPLSTNAPLTESGIQAVVKANHFPDQLNILPHDGDKVTVAGNQLTWHAVDTKNYNINLYHFAHNYDKPSSYVLFWAVTIVNVPEDMNNVRLAIGSNAASVWWVNGQEVIDIYGDRQTVIDDGVSKRLTLHKGPNVVRCAVYNAGGATDFCARFLDASDKPLTDFTLSLPFAVQH